MSVAAPSTAQKSAGNYPKHHLNVRGLRISIENPAGSTRSGTAPDGTEWSTEMKHHYGYIRGTTGKDKDHLDVFLGPEPHAAHPVHIVNQVNEDGEFDEHKVMLGFKSKKDAIDAYHANYEEGWRGADTVATMAFPKFRQWATSGAKRAPARDIGKIEPKPGFKRGGSVDCGCEDKPGYQAGGLVKSAARLRYIMSKMPELPKGPGQVDELNRLWQLYNYSSEGLPLNAGLPASALTRIEQATPVLRRRSLNDLQTPDSKLATVFESNRTGAAAGPKRSREARGALEPSQFGANPTYGALLDDPLAPLDSKLTTSYSPKSTLIAPDTLYQYGPYGLIPKNREKLTYTLGDSLDHARAYAVQPATLRSAQDSVGPWHGEGSAAYDLGTLLKSEKPDLARQSDEFVQLFEREGLRGLGPDSRYPLGSEARLKVRQFGGAQAPLSPFEERRVAELDKMLGGRSQYDYAEVQGHGLIADDIERVVDYSLVPSLAAERKLKKLGIRYEPIDGAATPLGRLQRAIADGVPLSELPDVVPPGTFWPHTDKLLRGSSSPGPRLELSGTTPSYASGGSVPGYAMGGLTPLTNLGGSLAPAATAALIGAPGSDLGYTTYDSGAFGADAGVSGNTAGGLSPGTIGQALGVAGQLSGTPELGLMGGVIGATSAAEQGNYGPAGGLIGGLMGGPLGAAVGSLAGQYGSGTMSGKSVANAVLGLSVPGYGLANGLSGGALGAGLFGGNGGWNAAGIHSAGTPGIFGGHGATAGQTAVAAANQAAGKLSIDPMEALMGITGAFGTSTAAAGSVNTSGQNSGAVPGGPEGDQGGGGAVGQADAGGMLGGLASGDIGFRSGGRVQRYADGGSTNAAFGFYPQLQRRKPQNNDRTAAANMPLSAARGWLAGTLGLPGDITSLAKMGVGAVADAGTPGARWAESSNLMPTSEFYNEWLPGRAEGAANRFAEGAGNLFGGAGATTAVRPLERGALRAMEVAMSPAPRAGGRLAQRGVVKLPGGNWTDDPQHSIDSLLENMLDDTDYAWGRGPFAKYLKNDYGTLRDPIREQAKRREGAFADMGIERRTSYDDSLPRHRALAPDEPFLLYDHHASNNIFASGPDDEIRNIANYSSNPDARRIAEIDPADFAGKPPLWLDTAPEGTNIWNVTTGVTDDFRHVFDYINAGTEAGRTKKTLGQAQLENLVRNDPNHPHAEALELIRRGLDIDPDKLNALDVPTASLKTAEWDKFLQSAKQSAELNKGIKSVLKTYPESGHQWVELAPEGLKAEGQAMKHCVGGYCSSVEDGSTRILSLRGKDGKPAVTVEVRPSNWYDGMKNRSLADSDLFNAEFTERLKAAGINPRGALPDEGVQIGNALFAELFKKPLLPSIVQIKGPANRAPSKDVLPMVQDLIRGTGIPGLETFSDVRDLRNAGLAETNGKMFTKEEMTKHLRELGHPQDQINISLRNFGFTE